MAAPNVVRLLDATGSSTKGWQAAVADAVKSVAVDAADPVGVEITRQWAELSKGRLRTFRVAVRVAYRQPIAGARGKAS